MTRKYKATKANITKMIGRLNRKDVEEVSLVKREGNTIHITELLSISAGSAVPSVQINNNHPQSRIILGYPLFEDFEYFTIEV